MKKKIFILISIFALFIFLLPIRYKNDSREYGILMPWFSDHDSLSTVLCRDIGSSVWRYSEYLLYNEQSVSEDKVALEKRFSILGFNVWTKKNSGVSMDYEKLPFIFDETKANNEKPLAESVSIISLDECVFPSGNNMQRALVFCSIDVDDVKVIISDEFGNDIGEMEDSGTPDKGDTTKGDGIYSMYLKVDTDIQSLYKEYNYMVTVSKGEEVFVDNFLIAVCKDDKTGTFRATYIDVHVQNYLKSVRYNYDSELERRDALLGILDDLVKAGYIDSETISSDDSMKCILYNNGMFDVVIDYKKKS